MMVAQLYVNYRWNHCSELDTLSMITVLCDHVCRHHPSCLPESTTSFKPLAMLFFLIIHAGFIRWRHSTNHHYQSCPLGYRDCIASSPTQTTESHCSNMTQVHQNWKASHLCKSQSMTVLLLGPLNMSSHHTPYSKHRRRGWPRGPRG